MKCFCAVGVNKGRVRNNNEDNYYLADIYLTKEKREKNDVFVGKTNKKKVKVYGVFDGMGGSSFGEEASLIISENVDKYIREFDYIEDDGFGQVDLIVKKIVDTANIDICKKAAEKSVRMGSTFCLLVINCGKARIYNIGDSRIYIFSQNILTQLSFDDTVVGSMIRNGLITNEDAGNHRERHKITQHIGISPDEMIIELHQSEEITISDNDVFLLCSDGLTDMVTDVQIAEILAYNKKPKETCQILLAKALAGGGQDNITIIEVKCKKKPFCFHHR